jgi:CRP-like cAMP-binding protein
MSGLPMKSTTVSPGTQRNGVRRSIAPGLSIAERVDSPCSYLIESGVLAISVSVDGTPPTCVELLGAGTLIGFQTAQGPYTASYRAISSVEMLEIPPHLLRQAMQRHAGLQEAYLHQLRERVARTELVAACNAHHSLSERCALWLLRLHAQLGALLPVTHAFLATMLGVRRAGISVTLENLQRGGVIRQRRGSIEILDAAALRAHACACPDGAIAPACAIAAELINADSVHRERPRAWLDKAMSTQIPIAVSGDDGWARREAALQLCRNIVAKGLTLLEQ